MQDMAEAEHVQPSNSTRSGDAEIDERRALQCLSNEDQPHLGLLLTVRAGLSESPPAGLRRLQGADAHGQKPEALHCLPAGLRAPTGRSAETLCVRHENPARVYAPEVPGLSLDGDAGIRGTQTCPPILKPRSWNHLGSPAANAAVVF